jgi:HD-like signal output (HDOD) protein
MNLSDKNGSGDIDKILGMKPHQRITTMQNISPTKKHTNSGSRDAFLQKLDKEGDLPALGSAVSRVVQLASSEDQVIQDLTYFVLADVALTQKILRLANSVMYRTVSGGQVTTVSRAIFILGFETVKTAALTMLLVERLSDLTHSHAVAKELKRAMCASLIGREVARSSRRPGAEDAAIAALFANVGQIMVAAYDYPRYAAICELVSSGGTSEEQAAVRVLEYSYSTLSQAILRSWKIPETITQAIAPLPGGMLKPAKSSLDWIRQIASFSVEASDLVMSSAERQSPQDEAHLIARFGPVLNLDSDALEGIIQTVGAELVTLCQIMDVGDVEVQSNEAVPDEEEEDIPAQFLMKQDEIPPDLHSKDKHPSGKPMHAKELLLEGVQQVMQMSATGQGRINDIMLLVLETLFNSMGFRFATICLKDKKSNEFRARLALGEDLQRRKSDFAFAANGGKDLFRLAMESDSDLMISDAIDAKIQDLLPTWHRHLLPDARSFMILPIVVAQKPLGFFYGDRSLPAPEGVPSDEAVLIKMLKAQILYALNNVRT